MNDKTETCL